MKKLGVGSSAALLHHHPREEAFQLDLPTPVLCELAGVGIEHGLHNVGQRALVRDLDEAVGLDVGVDAVLLGGALDELGQDLFADLSADDVLLDQIDHLSQRLGAHLQFGELDALRLHGGVHVAHDPVGRLLDGRTGAEDAVKVRGNLLVVAQYEAVVLGETQRAVPRAFVAWKLGE